MQNPAPPTNPPTAFAKAAPFLAAASIGCAAASYAYRSVPFFFAAGLLGAIAFAAGGRSGGLLMRAAVLVALGIPGWQIAQRLIAQKSGGSDDLAIVSEIVTTEEQILALTPQTKKLSKAVLNLRLPDAGSKMLFADSIEVVDQNGGSRTVGRDALDLWRADLDAADWFEHAAFKIVDGEFSAGGRAFTAEVAFGSLARQIDGTWRSESRKLKITWQQSEGDAWQIARWKEGNAHAESSPAKFFRESLADILPRADDYRRARTSEHEKAAAAYYRDGAKQDPHPYFAAISDNQKPGVSVADIDSDGDDDIYITVRLGTNLLLENQGDGTFIEAAELHGLHYHGHTNGAIFADFDNDGDPDLILARSLLPSLYLENENGYFRARGDQLFPALAVSASAADFNKDGLLDFYLCTYRAASMDGADVPAGGTGESAVGEVRWPDEFLPADQASEFYRRHRENNENSDPRFPNLLNRIGPPNALYVNRGGGSFERAPESDQVGVWRDTLQATWADYDEDGDPDLYLANDWAGDNFFRNDGDAGFTELTLEAGFNGFGFAMGASWGDYDNDVYQQDLYVSNMFSKAGTRITRRVPGLSRPSPNRRPATTSIGKRRTGSSSSCRGWSRPPWR
ncbi:MAG: VCBS repeat-containing protein [Verrucomicrobiales bacterium]